LVSTKGIIIVRIAEIFSIPPLRNLSVAFRNALPVKIYATADGKKDAKPTATTAPLIKQNNGIRFW
jgi:hypothetical protein